MKKQDFLYDVFRKTNTYVHKNKSTILTFVGAAGVVVTSISVAKETPKAIALLEKAREEKGEDLTIVETALLGGKAYAPSIIIGLGTITCIFGANYLNQKQQAALTSAYTLLESSFRDYRNKVIEKYGEEVDRDIQESLAISKRKEDWCVYAPGCGPLPTNGDVYTFYEPQSRTYFESTMGAVRDAEYHLNRNLAMRGYVMLNEFRYFLGLEPIPEGEAIGWDIEELMGGYCTPWLDFDHEKVIMDDGFECYIIHTIYPATIVDL